MSDILPSFNDLKIGERFYCVNDETNYIYKKLNNDLYKDNAECVTLRCRCRIPNTTTVMIVEEDDLK